MEKHNNGFMSGDKYSLLSVIYDRKFELVSKNLHFDFDNVCDQCNSSVEQHYFNFINKLDVNESIEIRKLGFLINTQRFYKAKIGVMISPRIVITSRPNKSKKNQPDYEFNMFINDYLIYWISPYPEKIQNSQYLLYLIEPCMFKNVSFPTLHNPNTKQHLFTISQRNKSFYKQSNKDNTLYIVRYIYSEKEFQFITLSNHALVNTKLSNSILFTEDLGIVVFDINEYSYILDALKLKQEQPEKTFRICQDNCQFLYQNEFTNIARKHHNFWLEDLFKNKNDANNLLTHFKVITLQNNNFISKCSSLDPTHTCKSRDFLEKLLKPTAESSHLMCMKHDQLKKTLSINSNRTLLKLTQDLSLTFSMTNTNYKQQYYLTLLTRTNAYESLYLNNLNPQISFFKELLAAIVKSNSLVKVDFSGNDIEMILESKSQKLPYNKSLNQGKCEDSQISGLNPFAYFFSKLSRTKELIFENCELSDKLLSQCFEKLYENENSPQLEHLNFNSNAMGNESMQILMKSIETHMFNYIRILELANNDISKLYGLENLINLESMNLYNNPIENEEAAGITRLISKQSSKLRKINMGKTKITKEFIIKLSNNIKDNNSISLERISISDNAIDDYSVNILSDVILEPRHNITNLDLSGCGLKDLGTLCNNLKLNKTIKTLLLDNNQIESPILNSLLVASCFTNLKRISLKNNVICNFDAEVLNDFFRYNNSLVDLSLNSNMLDCSQLKMFVSFIKYHAKETCLIDVDLRSQSLFTYHLPVSSSTPTRTKILQELLNPSQSNSQSKIQNTSKFNLVTSKYLSPQDLLLFTKLPLEPSQSSREQEQNLINYYLMKQSIIGIKNKNDIDMNVCL